MSFLQPWMLLGLPLVLVPIIIHLINRLRHRTVEWGAMMFLLDATRRRQGRARLRHLLILASRVAAVAGLILAVSRPLAGGWLSLFGGAADTVVVVLDRSASMAVQPVPGGESKRSASLQQIIHAISTTGAPNHLVLVDSASETAQEIDSVEALADLPTTWATDGKADLPELLQQTLEYVTENEPGRTEIWICSDLERNDWHAEGGKWAALRDGFASLAQETRFHLLAFRERPAENFSLRVSEVRREVSDDGAQLLLSVEGHREGGGGPGEVPLTVVLGGARSLVTVPLRGDTFKLVSHRLPMATDLAEGWGHVELPHDANPRDNIAYFVFGETPLRNSIVVSDNPESLRALKLAAAPPMASLHARAEGVSSASLAGADLAEVALILWQAPLPSGPDAALLERFTNAGGVVMFFPDAGTTAGEAFGCQWGAWEEAPLERPFLVESWRDDSGLLRDADSGTALPVGRLEVRRCREMVSGGSPLAHLSGSRPLLQRAELDRGHVYFWSTTPTVNSNLAREGVVFVVAVQRALALGAKRLEAAQHSSVGEPVLGSEATTWSQLDGWSEGELTTQAPHVAGVYRVGEKLLARNRPASEDGIATLDPEELETLFAGLDLQIVDRQLGGGSPLIQEIWRLLMVAMIVALLAEACLCLPDAVALGRGGRSRGAEGQSSAKAGPAESSPAESSLEEDALAGAREP